MTIHTLSPYEHTVIKALRKGARTTSSLASELSAGYEETRDLLYTLRLKGFTKPTSRGWDLTEDGLLQAGL